jgi:hypothetical protein
MLPPPGHRYLIPISGFNFVKIASASAFSFAGTLTVSNDGHHHGKR